MADKYFKLQEAQELLPAIGSHLEEARAKKQKVEVLDQELSRAATQITALGGSIPRHAELAKKRAEHDRLMAELEEALTKIHETGCLVKDLNVGLVDFPTLRQGEEVYLCWKLGEERIEYWHGIHEGFAGRKLLEDTTRDDDLPPGRPRIQ